MQHQRETPHSFAQSAQGQDRKAASEPAPLLDNRGAEFSHRSGDVQGRSEQRMRPPLRSTSRPLPLGAVLARGLLAGAAGVAAMTLAEKFEQALTKRPNSYVPAHTLERLLGLPGKPDRDRLVMNWAMHWGQGIALGMVRALMAQHGIRGPVGSFLHMNLRLLNDQTLENATGVGAPPWTWPVDEQVIDLLHKAIYAYATGAAADWLVDGPEGERAMKGGHYYE